MSKGRTSTAVVLLLLLLLTAGLYVNRIRRHAAEIPGGLASTALPTRAPTESSAESTTTVVNRTATPAGLALIINGRRVGYFEFGQWVETKMARDPGLSRAEACEQASARLVRHYLLWQANNPFDNRVVKATATAVFSSLATEIATYPNGTAQAVAGTFDPDVFSLLVESSIADQAMPGRKVPTPTESEIWHQADLDRQDNPAMISLARIDFASMAEKEVLVSNIEQGRYQLGPGEFAARFLERAREEQGLDEDEDVGEYYEIKADVSAYPDYAQDAILLDWGTEAPGVWTRPDGSGSGVVMLVLTRDDLYSEDRLAAARYRLLETRAAAAQDAYVAQLKKMAEIQMLVDCATY